MRTSPSVERLHSRLGGTADRDTPDGDGEGDGAGGGGPLGGPGGGGGEADGASLSRWLPEDTAPARPGWLTAVRADPGRSGAIALGAVAVVAVLVTVFLLASDDTAPVASAKLPPVEAVPSAPATPDTAPAGPVVVSVAGLVHRPGLVTLQTGARVADALTAAGGTVDGADLIGLNMARRVNDGEQIIVGVEPLPGRPPVLGSSISGDAAAPGAGSPGAGSSGDAPPAGAAPSEEDGDAGQIVDLNTATTGELDTLPGVGPVTAAAIVAHREQHGPFGAVEELGEVDGIGPARLDKLRDRVRV